MRANQTRTARPPSGRRLPPYPILIGLVAMAQPVFAMQWPDIDPIARASSTGRIALASNDSALPGAETVETSCPNSSTLRLVYPSDGAERTRRYVSLLWLPDRGCQATSYELELNGTLQIVAGGTSFDTLLALGTHRWRVRSLGGAGEWSDEWSFEIIPRPPHEDNERTGFFDEFVAKTRVRTAWSPVKWEALGTTYERELEVRGIRAEFAMADTSTKMLRAVHKLNHLRRDRHLRLDITADAVDNRFAPIEFYPDLEDESQTFFFVANLTEATADMGVNRGDRLLAVNGIPTAEYMWLLEPYLLGSTRRHIRIREAPTYLSAKNTLFGPELYAENDSVSYLLENRVSGEWYEVTLNYDNESAQEVPWMYDPVIAGDRAPNADHYRSFYQAFGFELVFDNELDAALYLNRSIRVALIEWYDLEDTKQSISDLMAVAAEEGALGYDVIVDGTHGSGGTGSELVVRALADAPFKTTFGNVRVDDLRFVLANKSNYGPAVEEWIDDAVAEERSYTTNEPFKLRNFPRGSDGYMNPSEPRFTGEKVMLLFPWGGSNLDQFAAMAVDNPQTGIHTIGMTMGGYSNTWEWADTLSVPGIGSVQFEWNVGHTIRPNGEILEGNPARADSWVPFTRENFDRYFELLMARAFDYLGHQWTIP